MLLLRVLQLWVQGSAEVWGKATFISLLTLLQHCHVDIRAWVPKWNTKDKLPQPRSKKCVGESVVSFDKRSNLESEALSQSCRRELVQKLVFLCHLFFSPIFFFFFAISQFYYLGLCSDVFLLF